MNRLLVNPGTPQAWEIQLKSGANRLGRSDQNDFQVNHPSVSGSHCEIIVSSAGVLLKDLGSTNGTFLNRARVQEALLQSGHHLHLGGVEMVFEAGASPAAAVPVPVPVPVPVAARVVISPKPAGGALRISGAPPAATAPAEEESPPLPPPGAPPVAPIMAGGAFCKSHQKTPARFYCGHCQKYFCDLCVTTRPTTTGPVKTCRACGTELTPVQVAASRQGGKSFYARLPATFLFPFKGSGVFILIIATIVFTALDFVSGGIFGIFMKMAVLGYLFLFLQAIVHATASDDDEMPGLPGGDDVFGAFFQLAGSVMVSFGVAIGLGAAKVFFDVDVPAAGLLAAILFGCFYFPMAFLAVAMKDSVMAANPLVVLPSILKVPAEYVVTVIFLTVVFGFRKLGDYTMGLLFSASLTTKSMATFFGMAAARAFWAFASLYLLTVMMRILGLLYVTKKHKLGWFAH